MAYRLTVKKAQDKLLEHLPDMSGLQRILLVTALLGDVKAGSIREAHHAVASYKILTDSLENHYGTDDIGAACTELLQLRFLRTP